MLRVKLRYVDEWTQARQRHAATYRRLLAEMGLSIPGAGGASPAPGVRPPSEAAGRRHVYRLFVIRSGRRDALRAHLTARGIGSEVYYPVPLHRQECFAGWGQARDAFPVSEGAAAETLALPIYPELTEAMQKSVVETIAEFYQRAGSPA